MVESCRGQCVLPKPSNAVQAGALDRKELRCWPGKNQDVLEDAERVIAKAAEFAQSLGNVPVILCGDFNLAYEESPTLQVLSQDSHWFDFSPPGPTHVASKGARHIDYLFLNEQAQIFAGLPTA